MRTGKLQSPIPPSPKLGPSARVWELSPTNPARVLWENEEEWSGSLWMCQRMRRGSSLEQGSGESPSLRDFIHVDVTCGDMGTDGLEGTAGLSLRGLFQPL